MKRSKIFIAGLVLMMAVASLWVVAPAAAAGSTPNPIVVRGQDTNNGIVVVDSVNAPADGWLLIWKDANGAPGSIIGWAPVQKGMNKGISVALRSPRSGADVDVTPVLWASFAPDSNASIPFAAPNTAMFEPWAGGQAFAFSSTLAGAAPAPAAQAGNLATTGGASSAPATKPAALSIVAKAQDTNAGQVVINSVTAPADGWLIIRRDANGAPGGIAGWAPVHQGVNKDVAVDLSSSRQGNNVDITQTLWATFAADPNATTPFATPGDGLNQWMGGAAFPFSSTAAGGIAG